LSKQCNKKEHKMCQKYKESKEEKIKNSLKYFR
jgi:hypothetical protein